MNGGSLPEVASKPSPTVNFHRFTKPNVVVPRQREHGSSIGFHRVDGVETLSSHTKSDISRALTWSFLSRDAGEVSELMTFLRGLKPDLVVEEYGELFVLIGEVGSLDAVYRGRNEISIVVASLATANIKYKQQTNMSWLSTLLRSKSPSFDPSTFEKELTQLSKKITHYDKSIIQLTQSRHKFRSLVFLYGFGLYFSTLAYLVIMKDLTELHIAEYLMILLFPVLIVLTHTLGSRLYTYRITNKETRLETLKQEHSTKIEELKDLANFQTTKSLLERFNNGEDLSEKLNSEIESKKLELISLQSQSETLQSQLSSAQSQLNSNKKHWMGSIVDLVTDEKEFTPQNRYALICQNANCLNHNGLAPPGVMPQFVKYVCPRCGVFNGRDPDVSESASDSGCQKLEETEKEEEKEEKEEEEEEDEKENSE
ncbi:hypothetical protein WICPIJ_009892 [Wickerhamomyces pijperi]|uniref:Endoplasmic reticulum junction formation protein lunapark n=1 Tax=Wickerhamomyces pijperi TaxID=599730 RepID=A0A9P8TB88_WICPI|nr:hypothetical protein WICPIJ_009892 [Wickerhamomyces pijperi]